LASKPVATKLDVTHLILQAVLRGAYCLLLRVSINIRLVMLLTVVSKCWLICV